jgi:hypothetical protein
MSAVSLVLSATPTPCVHHLQHQRSSSVSDHWRFGGLGEVLDPNEVFRLFVGGGKFQGIIGELSPRDVDWTREYGDGAQVRARVARTLLLICMPPT